ncbi:MAG: PHB depolymerase family esterase [Dehalococcoidia bacterium]
MNRAFPAGVLLMLVAIGLVACGRSSPDRSPTAEAPATTTIATTVAASPNPSAPAKTATSITHGVSHGTIEFAGIERSYRLFVPSGVEATEPAPLVVALHGGLGSGDQFAGASNFETLAESEGFIVVFPDGLDRTWNAGTCCGQSVRKNTDDVGFLANLIDQLEATLPVDPERVFMTGHSNGAMMAFRFGCERADMVKAIAPVAGSIEIPSCQPSRGVSLIAIHGDADQNHPIDGGEGPRSIAGVSYRSMHDTLDMWTAAMNCESEPDHRTAGALTSTVWVDCRDNTRATYMVIAGADHPWPGGVAGSPALSGTPSQALDATLAVWSFFKTLP